METTPSDAYDKVFTDMVEDIHNRELDDESTTTAISNLVAFSKVQVNRPDTEPEPDQPVVPTTRLGRAWAGVGRILDNETTRALIKAGGAFAGVAFVANATIKKDHVLERQALDQAHQQQR